MSLRLILLRHAKSRAAEPGQGDRARPLNDRGRRDAAAIGQWLRDGEYLPDRALVSTAVRAQETWSRVAAVIGARPTPPSPQIYLAEPAALLAALRTQADAQTLLLLGHQPGIGALARDLLRAPPPDAAFAKYPTAAAAVIGFDMARWADVTWRTGALIDFSVPRALI